MMRHIVLVPLWCIATLAMPAPAHAFEILTSASDACHEKIMLGSLGLRGDAFGEGPSANSLFEALVAGVDASAVPADAETQSFIDDVGRSFDARQDNPVAAWMVASFVAGVREPDTRGFAIVSFNELRAIHVAPQFQAPHTLRKPAHDGEAGNVAAIDDARARLVELLQLAYDRVRGDAPIKRVRWTFAFYGEAQVKAYAPAFRLGQMSHTLQDAFTHTLRDADLNIVTVLNFAEAITKRHTEATDGLNHSDRLDECDVEDDFDLERIAAARRATVELLQAAEEIFAVGAFDSAPMDTVLDVHYAYRPGCTPSNDYCDSDWLEPARESLTEPLALSCATRPGRGPGGWLGLLLLATIVVLRQGMQRRAS